MQIPLSLKRPHTIVLAVAVVCVLVAVWIVWIPLDRGDTQERIVNIENGQSLHAIGNTLKAAGLIRSKFAFLSYVSLLGKDESLQAGRYKLTRDMSIAEITQRLADGLAESDDIKLIVKEGYNIWDVDEEVSNLGLATAGMFAQTYHLREGRLFPDTYRLKKDTPITEVYTKLLTNYNQKAGGPDIYTLITASILEKEAKEPEDMRMVADIIRRRLERGMLLQIDATVGYGWCLRLSLANNFTKSCDVTQAPISSEISKDSEYNTYLRHGLPPKPISNPGRIAIDAARNPLANDYLFYLSTRDGSQLIYSKTLAEHEANRRKYLGL